MDVSTHLNPSSRAVPDALARVIGPVARFHA